MWNRRLVCVAVLALLAGPGPASAEGDGAAARDGKTPLVGPATEKRFPPLKVPPGFQATLFACDPLIEYPSVISLGPRPGTLLLAHDYVTGLGVEIVRRDEIRLITDTDGDGYADTSQVYAKGFNSIQGLTWHDGTVYVMHAPFLTALSDTDGDDRADTRKDLLEGLGLKPEDNRSRLHCANGVVAGFDGWLYLAMGDNGTNVVRPEGDRLLFQQGGILRVRPDGSDLHVFAGGLRNIYDLALDDQLNVFVRDNENDGGDYMIRVYHNIFGADHGYPYHYRERTDLALGPLADLGRGSSAGGAFYGETAFPASHRDGLLFCEWGRSVVFYPRKAQGAGFAAMREQDFAVGAPTDPYGFKPTDLVVSRDGSVYISDWADGQRPKRGRGRIYRVRVTGHRHTPFTTGEKLKDWYRQVQDPRLLARVEAQARIEVEALSRKGLSAIVRDGLLKRNWKPAGRVHAVWMHARVEGPAAIGLLFEVAGSDPDHSVRVQAIRALADLSDPVLQKDRLDAGPGDAGLAERLAMLGGDDDPGVTRELIIALGRLQWAGLPGWLKTRVRRTDAVLLHAGQQALRRVGNWPATLTLLDLSDKQPARTMAARAVADRYDKVVVDGLVTRLAKDPRNGHRREYSALLSRVWQKPAEWKYWGYRPAPRPPHPVAWELSDKIARSLLAALVDKDRGVQVTTLTAMRREAIPVDSEFLAAWLRKERNPEAVGPLLEAVASDTSAGATELLAEVVAGREYAAANRLAALAVLDGRLKGKQASRLVAVGKSIESGPVLADLVRRVAGREGVEAGELFVAAVKSTDAGVRAAAVTALGRRAPGTLKLRLGLLLGDNDPRVRRAAAIEAGRHKVEIAGESLMQLARDRDAGVRAASLRALQSLGRNGVTDAARAALDDEVTLPAGLSYLGAFGGKQDLVAVSALSRRYRSIPIQVGVLKTFDAWEGRGAVSADRLADARAKLQGAGGLLLRWQVAGPLTPEEAEVLWRKIGPLGGVAGRDGVQVVLATGDDPAVVLPRKKLPAEKTVRVAWTEIHSDGERELEFRAAAGGRLRVAINGKEVYRRDGVRGFQPDFDRFDATVAKGLNRVVAWVEWNRPSRLQVRFRQKSAAGVLERYAQRALAERGDVVRGRKVFLNKERSLCLLCHRLGNEGARIGPDLTGIGRRFSKIHLVEALLEPSRAIAPSYQTHIVVLENGRVLTGVRVNQTPSELTLGDKEGKLQTVKRSQIEETRVQQISTMPDGVEKRLSDQEFVDLIAFLVSQKSAKASGSPK